MRKYYTSIDQAIGKTPLLKLGKFTKNNQVKANIFAKLEYFNPAGSIKDRAALQMIRDAEKSGQLRPGGTIIEPTSGNTGIGLAALAASLNYKMIVVMPETMSIERRKLIAGYGAEVVLTDGSAGMQGSIDEAQRIADRTENSIIAGQFENPSNARAHYLTTGPEILEALDGQVDVLVSAVGTGGTISGIGRYLKEQLPGVRVVAVEPETSAVLSGEKPGAHGIQGIGAGFVPKALDTQVYDKVLTVADDAAFETAREVARTEGVLAGISSGAALHAAVELGRLAEFSGKNIVVIFPDGGDRYLSTELFE